MTRWGIDPKSMASVKKQVDKIAVAGLNMQQLFATIGRSMEPDVRTALNNEIRLKNSNTPIAGGEGLLSVTIRPRGRSRFMVEIKGRTNKGKLLMSGRKKASGMILPRKGKAMRVRKNDPKMAGKVIRRARKVRYPGREDEIKDVAEAVVRTHTRHQIAKRTGLGPMGGQSVTRGPR